MYFNHIKYILIELLLIQTSKYLIICVGSILAQVPFWDTTARDSRPEWFLFKFINYP